MTIKDYILHKTGGLRMVPTVDSEESGKYIIMIKKGEYKSNFNRAKGWHDFEMRQYFEEYGVQKPGCPPTSTYRAGYRAVELGSHLDAMCRDIHSKVARATARQQAAQPNNGFTQSRNGGGGATANAPAKRVSAWGTPQQRTASKTTVEDLEPEHAASPETRAMVAQAPVSQIITPEHPQYQQMMTVVSEGLGISAMKDTITALQQRNDALQQQVQELHDRTESVANSMESVQTSITEVVSNQKAMSESWETRMKQTVAEALSSITQQQQQQQQLQAQQNTAMIQEAVQLALQQQQHLHDQRQQEAMQQQAKQQQESMRQMFQQFMLMAKQQPEQSTQPDTTAPTSVMIGSEPEVSSLTTEAQSPGKRSQTSAALPQVTTQKKTRPDPLPPSPAGTPCPDHPTAITGEETRGDAT
jgi:hypothetical protein